MALKYLLTAIMDFRYASFTGKDTQVVKELVSAQTFAHKILADIGIVEI